MQKPKHCVDNRWWGFSYFWRLSRAWGVGIRTYEFVWYDETFRFNGGGYLYGANPYIDYQVLCFYIRRYT